jgi:NodT family efflux transporter outer membrane factor (OMF) lipoprotein
MRATALTALVLALAACAAPAPESVPPPVELPETFSPSGREPLPDRWWETFDDPWLDEHVDTALAENLDLRTYWDRLSQFEAIARREGAARNFQLDGTAWMGVNAGGTSGEATKGSALNVGLVARYELDFWGRLKAREEAALLDVRAGAEDLRTAALSLSALVASTWYQIVEQRAQIDLLEQQIETNEQVLSLIRIRYRQGQFSAADVLRQEQLAESTRSDRIAAQSREQVLLHQLAVLLGRAPGTDDYIGPATFDDLPPLPDTGVPASLVERRPDVRASFYRILAADRDVAEAVADRYPRFALTGNAGTDVPNVARLFDVWLASLAVEMTAPIVDGGRRKAEVDRNRAVLSERLNEYGAVMLTAMREVEDALVKERKQTEFIRSLARQLELSEEVLTRLRDRYSKGALNYIDVLQALVSQQSLERNLIAAERQRIQFRIDLCRALAGGFEMERPQGATLMASVESGP